MASEKKRKGSGHCGMTPDRLWLGCAAVYGLPLRRLEVTLAVAGYTSGLIGTAFCFRVLSVLTLRVRTLRWLFPRLGLPENVVSPHRLTFPLTCLAEHLARHTSTEHPQGRRGLTLTSDSAKRNFVAAYCGASWRTSAHLLAICAVRLFFDNSPVLTKAQMPRRASRGCGRGDIGGAVSRGLQ